MKHYRTSRDGLLGVPHEKHVHFSFCYFKLSHKQHDLSVLNAQITKISYDSSRPTCGIHISLPFLVGSGVVITSDGF